MNFPQTGELHRRAGWQAALQDGPVGCTLRRGGVLHIKLGCGKGRARGLPFSAAHPTLFCNLPDHVFVQLIGPPFCLLCSLLTAHIFHLETRPSSPPALQLVLSQINMCFPQTSDALMFAMFKNFIHPQLLKPIFCPRTVVKLR